MVGLISPTAVNTPDRLSALARYLGGAFLAAFIAAIARDENYSTANTIFIIGGLFFFGWLFKATRQNTKISTIPQKLAAKQPQTEGEFHWPGKNDYEVEVVGESFYQANLNAIIGEYDSHNSIRRECIACIIPEDDNPYDDYAVRIEIDGLQVGHLSRDDARSFRRRLKRKQWTDEETTCNAIIQGGYTKRKTGEKVGYNVWLDIKPFF